MECLICFDDILDDYAIINSDSEKGIYHRQCLEKWFNDGGVRGIIAREIPKSYIVIKDGTSREILINHDDNQDNHENINTLGYQQQSQQSCTFRKSVVLFFVLTPVVALIGLTIWIFIHH